MTFLDGCYPVNPKVTVTEKTINVALLLIPSFGGCISAFSDYPVTFRFGPLAAGTYDVKFGDTKLTQLIVREAAPFTVSPYAVPAGGGTEVVLQRGGLEWSTYSDLYAVRVGGKNVPFHTMGSSQTAAFFAPPATAGTTTDIVVDARYYPGQPDLFVAHNALIYYDPSQPPNPAIAEPMLFPIAFDGPGAFGSQWRTENSVSRYVSDSTIGFPIFYGPPCDSCDVKVTSKLTLPPMSRPDGLLLWLLRGSEQYAVTSSRIRDVSRQEGNAVAAVPVVRGSDFKLKFQLPAVPIEPGARAVLRVWALGTSAVDLRVDGTLRVNGQARQTFKQFKLIQVSDQPMVFASIDLASVLVPPFDTNTLAPPGTKASADLAFSTAQKLRCIWAMISITDNQTQHVTIVAPQ